MGNEQNRTEAGGRKPLMNFTKEDKQMSKQPGYDREVVECYVMHLIELKGYDRKKMKRLGDADAVYVCEQRLDPEGIPEDVTGDTLYPVWNDYLDRYPDSIAIVSGGMGKGEDITEARAMHDWLVQHGLPEERVLMEPNATSTEENLRYSFEIIRNRGDEPDGNVAIVSSAYHLFRAKSMARLQGVQAAGVAAPWGYKMVMLNYFIREAFGVTHLWVFGW